ncbi:MAG TPA: hypothetical protein DEA08_18850, partial [Planctomycetes bacterium]|nr:hypothetical protein [Planctomycetota bacterium]
RPAAHELRLWCGGEEVKNPVSLASRALQALRKGLRAEEPRATTLAGLLFRSPLREKLPRPWLGLTLERFRTRFHAPLRREGSDATFDEAAARDLVQLSLGAESVSEWLERGPTQDALLDLLWRGVLGTPAATGSATQSPPPAGETTLQPAPPALEAPSRLGPYELREELGRGGMGVVWSAWDPRLEREVALKVLAGAAADAESLRRFAREARAMARLEHEGIAVVHEVVEAPPRPYYVMQLVRGQTLEAWLADEPTRPRVLEVVRRLAEALAYAHARGVVHRDVKPANVMIDADARPVLLDFGLALEVDGRTRLTATGQIMGTPRYMAPEQVEGSAEVGPAADVYSLGA